MTAEKIDDYTVVLRFAAPYGTFLTELATPLAQEPVLWARHYCQQFHPAYNPDVQDMIDATEAVEDWPSLFRLNCGEVEAPNRWANAERPTLDPWIVTGDGYSAGSTQVIMERNPYFWQVDTEGNQLPYVDTLQWGVAQDTQAILLEAIAGNIDMQSRRIDSLANTPVLAENRERGGYELFERSNSESNVMAIHFNHTHQDPVMRDLLTNRDVRIALSLGIDRDEIIDIVWQGQGEPWQIGPRPEHVLYNEQLGRQYTEYDPDRANELLDAAGYADRDGDGYRLLPNGERLEFNVNYPGVEQPELGDALEIIREQWDDLGVGLSTSSAERSIYYSRGEANEHDFMVWGAPGGLDPTLLSHARRAGRAPAGKLVSRSPGSRWYLSGGYRRRRAERVTMQRAAGPLRRLQGRRRTRKRRWISSARSTRSPRMSSRSSASPWLRTWSVWSAREPAQCPEPDCPASWMYPDPGPTLPQTYFLRSVTFTA